MKFQSNILEVNPIRSVLNKYSMHSLFDNMNRCLLSYFMNIRLKKTKLSLIFILFMEFMHFTLRQIGFPHLLRKTW